VDVGGDIAVSGPHLDGEPWSIGLADPLHPDQDLELLMIYKGGVATSGRDYRRWKKNGVWQHHIIDPRSGEPSFTDVLTATVIAPTAQAAEMAAKTVLIHGSVQGIAWLEKHSPLAGQVVLEDGQTLHSRNWINYVC
jgi:thiamine biosynthesis lipoprotein